MESTSLALTPPALKLVKRLTAQCVHYGRLGGNDEVLRDAKSLVELFNKHENEIENSDIANAAHLLVASIVYRFETGVPRSIRPLLWSYFLNIADIPHDDQFEQFIGNPQLDEANQRVINADVSRTRANIFRFKSAKVRHLMECLLTYYCKQNAVAYKQGMNEVLAPFFCLQTKYFGLLEVYNCFSSFVSMYLPKMFSDSSFMHLQYSLAYLKVLLKYHDPKLLRYLENSGITPGMYAIPWFLTLFSSKIPLKIALSFWEYYMCERDAYFYFFISTALLITKRDELFDTEISTLPEFISSLTFDSFPSLQLIWELAKTLKQQTPLSFYATLRGLQSNEDVFIKVTSDVEARPILLMDSDEVLKYAFNRSANNWDPPNQCRMILLDLRSWDQMTSGRFPSSIRLNLHYNLKERLREAIYAIFQSDEKPTILKHKDTSAGDAEGEIKFKSIANTKVTFGRHGKPLWGLIDQSIASNILHNPLKGTSVAHEQAPLQLPNTHLNRSSSLDAFKNPYTPLDVSSRVLGGNPQQINSVKNIAAALPERAFISLKQMFGDAPSSSSKGSVNNGSTQAGEKHLLQNKRRSELCSYNPAIIAAQQQLMNFLAEDATTSEMKNNDINKHMLHKTVQNNRRALNRSTMKPSTLAAALEADIEKKFFCSELSRVPKDRLALEMEPNLKAIGKNHMANKHSFAIKRNYSEGATVLPRKENNFENAQNKRVEERKDYHFCFVNSYKNIDFTYQICDFLTDELGVRHVSIAKKGYEELHNSALEKKMCLLDHNENFCYICKDNARSSVSWGKFKNKSNPSKLLESIYRTVKSNKVTDTFKKLTDSLYDSAIIQGKEIPSEMGLRTVDCQSFGEGNKAENIDEARFIAIILWDVYKRICDSNSIHLFSGNIQTFLQPLTINEKVYADASETVIVNSSLITTCTEVIKCYQPYWTPQPELGMQQEENLGSTAHHFEAFSETVAIENRLDSNENEAEETLNMKRHDPSTVTDDCLQHFLTLRFSVLKYNSSQLIVTSKHILLCSEPHETNAASSNHKGLMQLLLLQEEDLKFGNVQISDVDTIEADFGKTLDAGLSNANILAQRPTNTFIKIYGILTISNNLRILKDTTDLKILHFSLKLSSDPIGNMQYRSWLTIEMETEEEAQECLQWIIATQAQCL